MYFLVSLVLVCEDVMVMSSVIHLASRGTTLPGDIQRSSMLLEVYKCVQLNR